MTKTQVAKHLSGAGKSKRGGSKGDITREAASGGTVKKSGDAKVTKGKEMIQSNTSFPREPEIPFEFLRGR